MEKTKNSTVWVVNHYAMIPSKDSSAGRHLSLARELSSYGWDAVIIAASTRHPAGTQSITGAKLRSKVMEGAVPVFLLRAGKYGGNGVLRIFNMLEFTLSAVMPGMLRSLPKPDVIMGSTVHPLAAWAGMRLARRYRVPFVFEARDLWPETLIDLGRITRESIPARLLFGLEQRLVRGAGLVVSPLPEIEKYLLDVGHPATPTLWVSNGVALEDVVRGEPATDGTMKFLYFGSMGNANALDTLIRSFAAYRAAYDSPASTMTLIGDGPLKQDLIELARSLGLGDSVSFLSTIPRADIVAAAQGYDVLIANMRDLELYRYGMSMNKIFDYLAAAKPIIFATNVASNPVRDANAGICVSADSLDEIRDAMSEISCVSQVERRAMGERGRAHVDASYSYSYLASRLATGLDSLLPK